VIAIEPSPDTFEALRANMRAFRCGNVELHQVAVGETSGFVTMALSAQAAALKNTGARYVQEGGEIPRITIDSLALPTLGFLKLDIEGSEGLALQGAAETLKRCRPIVLFENKWLWSKNLGQPKNIVRDFLIRKRYRLLEQVSHDQIWGPA
jgi:FkbM family methyltransferase